MKRKAIWFGVAALVVGVAWYARIELLKKREAAMPAPAAATTPSTTPTKKADLSGILITTLNEFDTKKQSYLKEQNFTQQALEKWQRGFEATKARVTPPWASLFRQLNLPPDKQDKFTTLLVMKMAATKEFEDALEKQGISLDDPLIANLQAHKNTDPGLQKLHNSPEREFKAAVRELLGDADNERFRAYYKDSNARDAVLKMASNLEGTPYPITVEQQDQLTSILAANSERDKSGWVKEDTVNWAQARPLVSAVLTPAQQTELANTRAKAEADAKAKAKSGSGTH